MQEFQVYNLFTRQSYEDGRKHSSHSKRICASHSFATFLLRSAIYLPGSAMKTVASTAVGRAPFGGLAPLRPFFSALPYTSQEE